jgi:hypothetical protein
MAKADSDNTITQLYRDFERAYAVYASADAAYMADEYGEGKEEQWSRTLGRCNRIADRIVAAPSKNRDEMLLKIRVTAWLLGASDTPANPLTAIDDWKPSRRRHQGEEFHAYLALATLRDDIRRLGQHGLTAVRGRGRAREITSDKRVSRGQK